MVRIFAPRQMIIQIQLNYKIQNDPFEDKLF